jgi:hypothetical protein
MTGRSRLVLALRVIATVSIAVASASTLRNYATGLRNVHHLANRGGKRLRLVCLLRGNGLELLLSCRERVYSAHARYGILVGQPKPFSAPRKWKANIGNFQPSN